jgi:hypothetical protein
MCASARSKLVVLERLVGEVGGFGTPDDAEDDPDDAPGPIVRDEEARARCMPDEAVAREVSRPLLDNTAGTTTWFDAGEPGCGGDLTRKRSVVPRSHWDLSQLYHGLTGRYRTIASMPDTRQDADLRIRIPAH